MKLTLRRIATGRYQLLADGQPVRAIEVRRTYIGFHFPQHSQRGGYAWGCFRTWEKDYWLRSRTLQGLQKQMQRAEEKYGQGWRMRAGQEVQA